VIWELVLARWKENKWCLFKMHPVLELRAGGWDFILVFGGEMTLLFKWEI
jgi:hypothetical protein